MRDPRQEARRIPHSYQDTASGGKRVVLHHETEGEVMCPDCTSYAEAAKAAQAYVDVRFPGRTL